MRKLSIQNIDGKHIWQEHHDNYDQMFFLPRKMVERELSDESLFEIKILDEKIPPMQKSLGLISNKSKYDPFSLIKPSTSSSY